MLVGAAVSIGSARADNDVYVCTDANGVKVFTDVSSKGCKKEDLPGLTTFPVTKKTNAAPTNFPKVDPSIQKRRDDERKQILHDEMANEQKKLDDLNAEYNNGQPDRQGNEKNYAKYLERTQNLKDEITRSQQNIDALQREINGMN